MKIEIENEDIENGSLMLCVIVMWIALIIGCAYGCKQCYNPDKPQPTTQKAQ